MQELELVMDIETLEIFEVKYPSQDSRLTKDPAIDKAAPVQLSLFDSLKSMTEPTYTNSSQSAVN